MPKYKFTYTALLLILLGFCQEINAQRPDRSQTQKASTALWLGSYANFRLSKKLFWAGELHYRRQEHNNIPFLGRDGQIYNRHGIKYLFNSNLSSTVGGVLRLNFTPEPGNENLRVLVLEPRIWYEFVFAMPAINRFRIYHRIRIEHRWNRSNKIGADFTFRNRFRYKFYMKIPINNPKLIPGTFYFSPDVELIMQSGKTVVDSPLEDLRLFPHVGYIASPKLAYSLG
ncbi:MAG: DUF2490 domain-containing protein, partial [Chitinophagales bacterium]